MKKNNKKRTPPMDCEKAIRITSRMFNIGGLLTVGGIVIGSALASTMFFCLVSLPGLVLMGCGYYLHNRWAICPHCGAFLGEESRMVRKKPEFCDACGKKL